MPPFDEPALRVQLLSGDPTVFAGGLACLGAIVRQGVAVSASFLNEVLSARAQDARKRAALLGCLWQVPVPSATAEMIHVLWRQRLIDDPSPLVRACVAGLLADGTDEAQMPLWRALADDPEPTVRQAAAQALTHFSLTDRFDPLLQRYRAERDVRVKEALIGLLGQQRDPAILPTFVQALDDVTLRVAVLVALKSHFSFDDLVEADHDMALASLGVRIQGVVGIGRPAIVRRLIDQVRHVMRTDAEPYHRALATACMSYFDDGAPDVLNALHDASIDVRRAALEVLTTIDCPGAAPVLTDMYARDKTLRREVLAALGQQREASVVSFLTQAYRSASDDDEARLGAIDGLADLGMAEGLDTLVLAMGDASVWNRNAAAAGLWKVLTFIDIPPDAQVTARVVDALAPALAEPNAQVARHAARALGVTRSERAAACLLQALPRAEDELAAQILQSLGELKARDALPHLLAVRPGAPYRVLDSALSALSQFEDAALLPALVERLGWSAVGLGARENLIDRIMVMGGVEARACLVACLTDEDAFVRERAAGALEGFDHPEVVRALVERLQDAGECEDVHIAAARSLVGMRAVGTELAVMPLLDSPLPLVRRSALLILACLPGATRLRALDRTLDDEDASVRGAAADIGDMLSGQPIDRWFPEQDD